MVNIMKKLILFFLLAPLFLTAQTVKIGANLQVKQSTANIVNMSSDSGVRLLGSYLAWDDLMFPFSTGNSGGNPYPAFNADSLYYTFVLDTTGATKSIMYFIIQIPHKWKVGTDLHPHVHYKHLTATGTPTFKIKYKWFNIGASAVTPWKWLTLSTTTGTTNNTMQILEDGVMSATGKGISSILLCMVYLGALPDNVIAYQFDIHYQIDSFGSDNETSKK